MKLRIIVRIAIGIILALVCATMGYDRIAAALAEEPHDWGLLVKGVGFILGSVLMIAALVVSHRARQRIAARQQAILQREKDASERD